LTRFSVRIVGTTPPIGFNLLLCAAFWNPPKRLLEQSCAGSDRKAEPGGRRFSMQREVLAFGKLEKRKKLPQST
jgi:hypothetical protein